MVTIKQGASWHCLACSGWADIFPLGQVCPPQNVPKYIAVPASIMLCLQNS